MSILDGIGFRAAASLRHKANDIENLSHMQRYSWVFPFEILGTPALAELNAEIKNVLGAKCASIYTIHIYDEVDQNELGRLIESARQTKFEMRSYPMVNKQTAATGCLYVGSSRTTPSRIRGHLGLGPCSTFSLHLAAWARPLDGTFTLDVYCFNDTEKYFLPYLEDQLSVELSPILGKRGTR